MLEPQGPVAEVALRLMWLMVVLGAVLFGGILLLIWRGLRRRSSPSDDEKRLVRRWLVFGGTVIPSVVVLIVFGFTLSAMRGIDLEQGELTIEVVGHRWWWEVHGENAQS